MSVVSGYWTESTRSDGVYKTLEDVRGAAWNKIHGADRIDEVRMALARPKALAMIVRHLVRKARLRHPPTPTVPRVQEAGVG